MGEVDPKRRLADWFRQWRSPLRKFLLRRGSVPASDLDDIAQEVFLRLMRYDRTELIEHPQAYLFKMATNVVAEWAIRGRHMRAHEPKWLAELAERAKSRLRVTTHPGDNTEGADHALWSLRRPSGPEVNI